MTTREVLLEGGAPWGFRMHGGVDQNQPLRISRVNPGSKAAQSGIREGDLISAINGQSTKTLTNIEAHGLLRNSGEIIRLGLNGDPLGSPKRRQYRTIHQETLQETVKKSSVTTYSLTKTVETVESQTEKDNEKSIEKNEHSSINGTSKSIPQSNILVTKKPTSSSSSSPTFTKEDLKTISSDNALASQRSSYTNCTLSPSSPSILSEDGKCSCTLNQDNRDKPNVKLDNMNDTQSSSRSKRRRQRRKNRKITESQDNDSTRNFNCNDATTTNGESENILREEYTVQSPVELANDQSCSKKIAKPVKSRSLDDDEMVKIQEVSEVSDSENKENIVGNIDSQAIISEASESEVEWEETIELDTPSPIHGSLSTFTLPLEGYSSEQVTLMSPEEEKTLRDFLEGLNLVNGPEEAASQAYEKDSSENIKQRKARKKAELEQYFLPIYQNPRYLDVISEESSDRDSDREQSKVSLTRSLRKGTPENESLKTPPKVPPRQNRDRRKILTKSTPPVEQAPAVLVDTKIIDAVEKSEAICSTVTTGEEATASNVEIVYITSSGTDSPEELESNSSDSYIIGSDRNSSNEDLSEKTMVNVETDKTVSKAQNLNNTHRRDYESKKSFKKIIETNEILKTVPSTKYHIDKTENTVNIDLMSQLTPPPTPDNISPNDNNDKEAINPSLVYQINELNLQIEPEIHTNVLTPPPPSISSSSSRSSSRGSSLCTARYNPSTSSITEVISLSKEDIDYSQPLTLREICLKFLLSLPFGKEVLEELADVSKYIESFTRSLPSTVLPKLVPNLAPIVDRAQSNSNNLSYNLSVHLSPKILQEDLTYTNVISSEDNINEELKSLKEKSTPKEIIQNDEKSRNDNKNTLMKSKNIYKAESEDKTKLIKKEVIVPIILEKNVEEKSEDETKKLETQEIVIPITIENENYQRSEKSEKEVIIPIKRDKDTANTKEKPKEFIIPIIKENDGKKEIKIPNEKATHTNDGNNLKNKIKNTPEIIIPTEKQKNTEQSSQKKEIIIPIQKEGSAEKINANSKEIVTYLITQENKKKEFIIPIEKATDAEVENNLKDNIIKETKDKEFGSKPDDKLETKPKEFIVPITKEISTNTIKTMTEHKERNIPIQKEWTGIPTEKDPQLLLCLSPKQKKQIEKCKQIPDEAGKLIDLHEKFINRSTSHEEVKKNLKKQLL